MGLENVEGHVEMYDCRSIGTDSMMVLAEAHRLLSTRHDPVLPAAYASEFGHWEYDGYWREYCRVELPSYTILECGIWRYTEVPRWVEGENGLDATASDWDMAGGGPGGEGTASDAGDDDVEEEFCPSEDKNCWKVLADSDKTFIQAQVDQYLRPLYTISDQTAMAQCSTGVAALNAALATMNNGTSSKIWLGTGDNEPLSSWHTAETDPSLTRFHIDPAIMQRARYGPDKHAWRQELVALLMHESLHLSPYAKTHPQADLIKAALVAQTPPGQATADSIFGQDPFFKYVHSTQAATACVDF